MPAHRAPGAQPPPRRALLLAGVILCLMAAAAPAAGEPVSIVCGQCTCSALDGQLLCIDKKHCVATPTAVGVSAHGGPGGAAWRGARAAGAPLCGSVPPPGRRRRRRARLAPHFPLRPPHPTRPSPPVQLRVDCPHMLGPGRAKPSAGLNGLALPRAAASAAAPGPAAARGGGAAALAWGAAAAAAASAAAVTALL
jgi:hypothetical protein